jgi:ABC-2 type transport system ATP-binding protein
VPEAAIPEAPISEAAIEVRHLTKQFGAGVLAVDDVSFRVEPATVCGLLGPNGAGKTTTLRMLVGLVRPSAGETSILGVRTTPGNPVLARVGTMIEHAAFVPYLSGLTNLRLSWEAGGARFEDADVQEALAVADLGAAVNRKVKTYSQGMRQRLGVARALLGRPEVLVLDEPTSGLDPGEMREIRDLLRRLTDRGATVLLSSHLLSEVEQVCSHVVVMERGRLVTTGTVRELTASARSAYLEVGDLEAATTLLATLPGVGSVVAEPPGLAVELDGIERSELVRHLVGAGIAVDTVTSRHRLEDAFLGLMSEEP